MNEEVRKRAICALNELRMAEHMIPWKWCDKYHYLPPESSDTPGRFESFPYGRAWINWMVNKSVKRVAFLKSARIGYTKALIAAFVCLVVDWSRKVAVWHSTDKTSKEFVRTEIDTLFAYVPLLAERLVGGVKANNPHNTVRLKEFIGAVAYFRGAQTTDNFAGISPDVVIGDEFDRWPRNIGIEGSGLHLMRKRTEQSTYGKVIVGSSPVMEGNSQITEVFESSEMQMERYLPCPHCKFMHPLEWANFIFDRGEGHKAAGARFICPSCKGKIEQWQYAKMDEAGQWRAKDGTFYDEDEDIFVAPDGSVIHQVPSLGVYIWAAYSYFVPWVELANDFLEALFALKAGDESAMISFTNLSRGLAYRSRVGGNTEKLNHLIDTVEDYTIDRLPNDICFLTAGIDVQTGVAARLEVLIVGHSQDGKQSWHVSHNVIKGDINAPHCIDDLDYLLMGTYHTAGNKALRIKCVLFDEGDGNNVDEIRRRVNMLIPMRRNKEPLRLIARTYKGTDKGPYVHPYKEFGNVVDSTNIECHFCNHITGKDMLFAAAIDGRIHFNRECDVDYFTQFTAERRVMRRVGGEMKVKYEVKRPGLRCEILDCWNMAQAAKELYLKMGK